MRALQLKTFAPVADPERTRAEALQNMLGVARDEGYRSGYVAGHAAATEAHLADQTRLSSQLVEALDDTRITNEEARHHILAGLAPLIARIFETLAPSLADIGLPAEIGRRVVVAVQRLPQAVPHIRCAPEVAPAVTRLLAERGLPATVAPASELLPREAEVAWDQGLDHIDLDACIAEIRDCIASHLSLKSGRDENAQPQFG